jgi:hypothetical protein
MGALDDKPVRLRADQIRPLAPGRGACIATDMITVEGKRVGYMYRDEPEHAVDSGWRFLSGVESRSYIDNAENLALYDVNTIANYDPDIVRYLSAPVGSAFEREAVSGLWVELKEDDE